MQLLRATALLFGFQLRRSLRSRRTLLAALAALLPVLLAAALAWLASGDRHGPPPVLTVAWMLVVRVIVPLAALLIGAGVVAEEVEDRTIAYVFTRPVPRAALLLGRWLAAALVLTVLLGLSGAAVLAILQGAAAGDPEQALPPGTAQRILGMIIAGGLVYSALFAAAGTFLKHPVLVGAGYVFAVEGVLGTLPGNGQALTIQYYLKSYLIAGDDRLVKMIELVPEAMGVSDLAAPGAALWTLAEVLVVALAIGAWAVSRRQYVLSA